MISLRLGAQHAVVDPLGGRVVGYDVAGKRVLVGEQGDESPVYRSCLLAPWPNRVTGGRWSWRGQDLELPVNWVDGTAIHGFVAYAPFEVVQQDATSVSLAHHLAPTDGYPFPLRVGSAYRLTDGGLQCSLTATNTGTADAPVALGVHPYVDTRGPVDEVELTVPARSRVRLSPTWEDLGHEQVDSTPARVGEAEIDACWTDVVRQDDGSVVLAARLPDGDVVEVWGGPTTRWLVVYNAFGLPGDAHRRSLALEPNTAPANALRTGVDLDILAPGETLELAWGVRTSWAGAA